MFFLKTMTHLGLFLVLNLVALMSEGKLQNTNYRKLQKEYFQLNNEMMYYYLYGITIKKWGFPRLNSAAWVYVLLGCSTNTTNSGSKN